MRRVAGFREHAGCMDFPLMLPLPLCTVFIIGISKGASALEAVAELCMPVKLLKLTRFRIDIVVYYKRVM